MIYKTLVKQEFNILSTPFTKDYLEVVKQEMATVNIDSLGISELK